MKILDKKATVDYLLDKYDNGKRIAATRYGDGEYLMMIGSINSILREYENQTVLPNLLLKTIKADGHLLCIPQPKPHNIQLKDVWFNAYKFIIDQSKNEIYGHANWNVYDFQNGSKLISKFFYGKTLLVTSYIDECKKFFNEFANIEFLKAPSKNASLQYGELKDALLKIKHLFRNIVFSIGPISKVLVGDLVGETSDCNLIDFGSLVNAFIGLEKKWTMSWTGRTDLAKHINDFKIEVNKLYG